MTHPEVMNATKSCNELSSNIISSPKKRVDANDYSRFDNIDISDSETEEEKPSKEESKCRSCYKYGAKMKCSVCKKASYCNRKCQTSDWTFHRRTCKKPTPPNKDSGKPGDSSPATGSSKIKTKSSAPTTQYREKADGSALPDIVIDESDLDDVKGYKNGLPYFHRELSAEDQKLIGDTAPKRLPVVLGRDQSNHEGSAWNAAGTFEERNFMQWARQKLSDILSSVKFSEGTIYGSVAAPLHLTGDASICVIRGRKRYLFDFSFELPFVITIEDVHTYKGSYTMHDISNDDDYEISYRFDQNLSDAAVSSAIETFVGDRHSGLQQQVLRAIGNFVVEFEKQ